MLTAASMMGACGGGDDNLEASIQGYAFSFKQGTAILLKDNSFWIDLYDATYPRCGTRPEHDNVRLDGVPAAIGHYLLSHEVSVLFSGLDNVTVEGGGTIDITELTDTTVGGTVHVVAGPYEWAKGRFRSDICPSPWM